MNVNIYANETWMRGISSPADESVFTPKWALFSCCDGSQLSHSQPVA